MVEDISRTSGSWVVVGQPDEEGWSNSFTFAYSRRDKTWQLVRAEVSFYYAPDADSTEKSNIYLPPKDFGKIDIADFDPDRYLKVRSRR
jgi:hypothetical protein